MEQRSALLALVFAALAGCGASPPPVEPAVSPQETPSKHAQGTGDAIGADTPDASDTRQPAVLSATSTLATQPPTLPPTPAEPTLSIYVVDVGQGDSTVVLGPSINGKRRVLVMDAGHYQGVNGRDVVAALLGAIGVTHIDYVVLSHYDADHMGGFTHRNGASGLLWSVTGSGSSTKCTPTKWFPTTALIDSGPRKKPNVGTKQWLACAGQVAKKNQIDYKRVAGGAHIGEQLELGGGVTATIVAGGGYVLGTPTQIPKVDTENEQSIALLVSDRKGFEFLVTGDLIGQKDGAEDAELEVALGKELAARGIDIEVLRVGHHGAANATEASFIDNTTPEVAIISCGDKQGASYRHPRCDTDKTLEAARVPVVLQTQAGNTDCTAQVPTNVTVVDGTIHIELVSNEYSIRGFGATGANSKPTSTAQYTCASSGCTKVGAVARTCCRTCRASQPCGDSCIPAGRTCTKPPGCACGR